MASDATRSVPELKRDEPAAGSEPRPSLEQLGQGPQPSLMADMLDFLKHNKKWWLLPILLILGAFGVLMALASTSAAPFIYTLF